MSYKDKDLQRTTTRERVKRHRAKQKGVTGVTCSIVPIGEPGDESLYGCPPQDGGEVLRRVVAQKLKEANCPTCGGNGFIEYEHGLIRMPCKECRK